MTLSFTKQKVLASGRLPPISSNYLVFILLTLLTLFQLTDTIVTKLSAQFVFLLKIGSYKAKSAGLYAVFLS